MIKIYGIKNCDTMKKAFKWLDSNNVDYDFHDYKKLGVDEAILKQAISDHGWEIVINKHGTTWRQLDESVKNAMDAAHAVQVAAENPSIIKRPILLKNNKIIIGFDETQYQNLLDA